MWASTVRLSLLFLVHLYVHKFTLTASLTDREGLVLQDVKFNNRSVMNKGSLVEMAVPYGDPRPPFSRKCAFDVGDYGLGYCAVSRKISVFLILNTSLCKSVHSHSFRIHLSWDAIVSDKFTTLMFAWLMQKVLQS